MGNCTSAPTAEEKVAVQVSKEIDKKLKAEQETSSTIVKLLLLGAGETGKSTILKQLKLIHGIGFSEDERRTFRSAITLNVMTCAKTLVKSMTALKIPFGFVPSSVPKPDRQESQSTSNINMDGDGLGYRGESKFKHDYIALAAAADFESRTDYKIPDFAHLVESCDITFCFGGSDNTMPVEIYEAVLQTWKDSGIQYCFSRANEFQLLDSCAYFMADLPRICDSAFVPTDQDILAARILTTRVAEIKFMVQDVQFVVYDLGGQRSERKKWVPYFDNVQAIIFLVAISSYDQVCFEDGSTNRMVESMTLFSSICNHPAFKKTSMLVFMNKIDLFKLKLETSPVQDHFPNFTGANTFENASEFFSRQFVSLNKCPEKKMYIHFTWATDTKQITKVLATVNHIILSSNLDQSGL
ncbi:G protein alpha subunit [Rhizoclosmatium globosum]|uniref:G protein alpha subunit n=1 Tax=Rhizoclosmatium globosum TaxID=329046 RepID=A0A1Y2CX79_9FUNG|nr:G protein alpha subunit [Rhizoclosmatium globosum]|eukprot:ORY51633.1 G protein alpha subunit [Rhizoclosmatium globosum]